MNSNSTELVFILDRSGSMAGLEGDTIGGFNAMLQKQKEQEGEARVTTALFDNEYELLHDRLDLPAVSPITEKDYFVRGSTALLDAIGRTIQKVDTVMEQSAAEYRAGKVLFVIITDGMENASHRFSRDKIALMVSQRREQGWEFIFLGANMDAIQVAQGFGIAPDRAQTFEADGEGVNLNYEAVSELTSHIRANRPIPADWDRRIRDRKKKA